MTFKVILTVAYKQNEAKFDPFRMCFACSIKKNISIFSLSFAFNFSLRFNLFVFATKTVHFCCEYFVSLKNTQFFNYKMLISILKLIEEYFFLLFHGWAMPRVSLFRLKVSKCEIFHLFDFNDFYGVKSL
jgi:hypothetical protein